MYNFLKYCLLYLFLLALTAKGQDVISKADTTTIRIGEQFHISLYIDYRIDNGDAEVSFPVIGDTLPSGIEILTVDSLNKYLPDSSDQFLFREEKKLTLTSFDTGFKIIPPFRFLFNKKEILTDPILIEVQTVQVDTTQPIKDVKGIYKIPYLKQDDFKNDFNIINWLKKNWMWLLLLVIILTAAIWFIIKIRKKTTVPKEKILAPTIPPYEKAILELNRLKDKHLWQEGKIKAFHIQLSDILREYLENRYGIHALEQTTDTIVQTMGMAAIDEESKFILNQVLTLSDMVKFAKDRPVGIVNDQSLTATRTFVENTKPVIVEEEKSEKS